MAEFSKSERNALRELASLVYEADARLALEELDAKFARWRNGELLGSDLIAAIHDFHQNDARVLWSVYQALKDPEIVARGLALGLIATEATEAVSDALRNKLAPLMSDFNRTLR